MRRGQRTFRPNNKEDRHTCLNVNLRTNLYTATILVTQTNNVVDDDDDDYIGLANRVLASQISDQHAL